MSERKRTFDVFSSHNSSVSKKPHIPQTTSSSESGQNDQDTSTSSSNIYNIIANVDISDPEWLEKYQKEAIYRAMKEYQRQADRASEFKQELIEKEEEYKKRLNLIDQFLDYLQKYLTRFDEEHFVINFNSNEDQTLENTKNFVKVLIEKILIWLHDQDILIKTLQADKNLEPRIIDIFTQKSQYLNKFYQSAIDKVNFQDKKLIEDYSITRELEATKSNLDSTSQQLEAAQDKLIKLEKNVDRSNSFTLNPYLLNERKSESNDQSNSMSNRPIAERMELSDLRTLAENRLRECNDSQAEKIELKKRIYEFQEKLKYVPEERIKESESFKSMQLELDHLRQSYDLLYTLFEEKSREVQGLTASRDKADDLLRSEMKRMDQEFQDIKQGYLIELDRIRTKRNELVKDVETLRSMIPQEFRQISAIRMLANDRLEFINILKEEIRKLNIKLAAFDGNRNAIEHIRNVQLSQNDLTYRESQRTDLVKYITDCLSYDSRSNNFDQKSQDSPVIELLSSQKPEELYNRIKDLEITNEILKKLEKRDDANHKKAFEICSQDQRVYTLKQSLTKFQQRLNAVTMENVSLTKERSSMAVVIQNQINVIRQNSYLLTNYKSQLEIHKREVDNSIQALSVYKQKYQEFELDLKREKTTSENLRIDKINKAREFSAEMNKRDDESKAMLKEFRHVKEQLEGKSKQIEELRKTQSSTVSSDTLKLLEAYETKWKCSTCNTRFKDHCLTLCMHAFCKPCLERQLESRNRKCANCGQQFGKTDIRQIYF
ncbi:9434_t:CDS:10 [Diversispora eburnea]|uniref:E3 ubiquitin protein ligase n=1 Tax=Diversispora eburnea TaxID=1213867 RepID=A0A9N9AGJ8_9GLOM|nr:9434_t:CDS:10 [Diversispora eburnea]